MLQDTISSAIIDAYISIFSLFCKTIYGSNISYDTWKTFIYICIKNHKTHQIKTKPTKKQTKPNKPPQPKKGNKAPKPHCITKMLAFFKSHS